MDRLVELVGTIAMGTQMCPKGWGFLLRVQFAELSMSPSHPVCGGGGREGSNRMCPHFLDEVAEVQREEVEPRPHQELQGRRNAGWPSAMPSTVIQGARGGSAVTGVGTPARGTPAFAGA